MMLLTSCITCFIAKERDNMRNHHELGHNLLAVVQGLRHKKQRKQRVVLSVYTMAIEKLTPKVITRCSCCNRPVYSAESIIAEKGWECRRGYQGRRAGRQQ
jgi:hypothetical protein